MSVDRFHIAQANVAHMRAPLEDPIMEGFRSQLERINAVADRSPGFVWRLQTAEGDATAIRAYDDERILFNMSVWESVEALHHYVYRSDHVGPLRRRRDWFVPYDGPVLVLWWIPAEHLPTVDEAKDRLRWLEERGPTPEAFTFRHPFPPPGSRGMGFPKVDAEFCNANG
jgi:Domain of unknown function (DUF3291)